MWRVSETADKRRGQQSVLGAEDPVLAVYYVGDWGSAKRERGGGERLPVRLAIEYQLLNCTMAPALEVDIGP